MSEQIKDILSFSVQTFLTTWLLMILIVVFVHNFNISSAFEDIKIISFSFLFTWLMFYFAIQLKGNKRKIHG